MTIQLINDEEGNPQYVVIGYEEYTRMISYDSEEMIENDKNDEVDEVDENDKNDEVDENDENDENDTINYNSDEYYY